jgi:peptide/nickel transport system substrate-binding protein
VAGATLFASPSRQIVLEAFEDYWDRRYPKVKRVIFDNTLISNRKEAMRRCMEVAGFVDIVSHIRPLDTLRVAASPFAKVVKSNDVTLLGGVFNQRKRDKIWKDIRLRKAVNYAIDRKELWRFAAKGNARNLGGYLPLGAFGHNPNLDLYTYDVPKARSLLKEAGYSEGVDIKIITTEAWKVEAQIISKMLERISLRVKLRVLTTPEFFQEIVITLPKNLSERQDWDLMIWMWPPVYGHSGAMFLTLGFIEASNIRWIADDPRYEEMWKDMVRTSDIEIQETKIQQMVQYVYNRAYALFIYSPLSLYAVNKEVNFIPQKSTYLCLMETSVTENHWSLLGKNN